MTETLPWIADFVQQCVSSYLGEGAPKPIKVHDDGSKLTFKVNDLTEKANIHTWRCGSSCDIAVLMDPKAQIHAKISKGATADCSIGLPSGQGPEKYEIELLDFELVLTYSASPPDVHLIVNRFHIDWKKGVQKFQPSRKLRKDKHVRVALDRARQKANDSHRPDETNGASNGLPESSGSDIDYDSKSSPQPGGPLKFASSQQLYSQIPVNENAGFQHLPKPGILPSHAPTELLQRLVPAGRTTPSNDPQRNSGSRTQAKRTASDQPQGRGEQDRSPIASSHTALPLAVVDPHGLKQASTKPQEDRTQTLSKNQRNASGVVSPQPGEDDKASGTVPANEHVETPSSQIPSKEAEHTASRRDQASLAIIESNSSTNRPSSRKRQRESVESQPHASEHISESVQREVSPSKKRPRTGPSTEVFTEPAGADQMGETKSRPSPGECQKSSPNHGAELPAQRKRSDPWKGLSMISDSEVNIPSDQTELLLDRPCWIPPLPKDPEPQGHVPPSLLRQWNIIAQRRHSIAQEPTAVASMPPSPIQDTIISSPSSPIDEDADEEDGASELSWAQSPPRTPYRNVLPPSSSPVKQPSLTEMQAGSGGQIGHLDQDDDTANSHLDHAMPEAGTEALEKSSRLPTGFVTEPDAAAAAAKTVPPSQDAVSEQGQPDVNVSMQAQSTATGSQEPRTEQASSGVNVLERHRSISSRPAGPASLAYDDDSADDSDDSMMDTSVPLALGESCPEPTQSTEGEQVLTSSYYPQQGDLEGHVQVAVTPVVTRLHGNKPNLEQPESGPYHSQSTCSPAQKLSSQPGIMNTYPHPGSHEKSQSSLEGAVPSSLQSENRSPRVDVAGTQPQSSSPNAFSQAATQSQEIVLDSSGKVQGHQDSSLSDTNAANETVTLQSIDFNKSTQTQPDGLTQESVKDRPSQDCLESSPQAVTTACLQTTISSQVQSHQQSNTHPGDNDESGSQERLRSQRADSVASMGNVSNRDKLALAVETYLTFRTDYSKYTGDFNHFTELCSKLQGVRAQGHLQLSCLWDDFIIIHSLKYPSHIKERGSQGLDPLIYEDYFRLNFTHPLHKRHSLTTRGIKLAASQFFPTEQALPVTNNENQMKPPAQDGPTDQSSTGSLHESSDFNTHTSNEVPQSGLPVPQPSATNNSQDSSLPIKQEDFDPQGIANLAQFSVDTDKVKVEEPPISSFEPNIDQVIPKLINNCNSQDEGDISMDEIEETDLEDEAHETASPELGDESFTSDFASSRKGTTAEPNAEPESQDDENWFVALSRMHPTSPVWSHDPNTPFKRWVEAHENVESERLRREGERILFDEDGVIRRSTVSPDEEQAKPSLSLIIARNLKSVDRSLQRSR